MNLEDVMQCGCGFFRRVFLFVSKRKKVCYFTRNIAWPQSSDYCEYVAASTGKVYVVFEAPSSISGRWQQQLVGLVVGSGCPKRLL